MEKYRVNKRTGCWAWEGSKQSNGYGVIWMPLKEGDKYCGHQAAHKAFYRRFVGPIPRGYVIDHLCLNKSCVNPQHLEAVTHGENLRRSSKRCRGTTIQRGKRKIHVGICTCLHCGHRWLPRINFMPLCCASCKSPYWRRVPIKKQISKQ